MPAITRLTDRLLVAHAALLLGVCAVMAVYVSLPLRNVLAVISSNTVITIALYGLISYAVYAACALPLSFFQQHNGPLPQRVPGDAGRWIQTYIGKQGRRALRFMIVLQVVYLLLQTKNLWWLWLAGLSSAGVLLWQLSVAWLMPGLMKLAEVEDRELRRRLVLLGQRLGIRAEGVYASPPPHGDILRCGARLIRLGKRIRIVIHPSVVDFSPEEVESLLARDLARHHLRLFAKRYAAQVVCVTALCAAAGISFAPLAKWLRYSPVTDIATAPILVGLVVLFGIPLRLGYQALLRQFERATDQFVLQLTRAPEAFVSVFMRRAAMQPETAEPQSWLELLRSSDPPLAERIAAARSVSEELLLRRRRGAV